MKLQKRIRDVIAQEDLNFLLTNRLPRNALTRFLGWFSKIEQPWVRDTSIAVWSFFTDLDLSEAKKSRFTSMHDCFTRELKPGARPVNQASDILSSPVDAIVGSHGQIADTLIFQAKGFPYTLEDLIGPEESVDDWRNGCYMTLRLTSSMYHRFHAPYDCRVDKVRYFSGDTWNVNPIALKRVEKLFCKNERAFIRATLHGESRRQGQRVALVPVAAILVASIRLHFLDVLFHLRYAGPPVIECDHPFLKGQEMGWFQHGSTMIVLAPKGSILVDGIQEGTRVKVGQALMRCSD